MLSLPRCCCSMRSREKADASGSRRPSWRRIAAVTAIIAGCGGGSGRAVRVTVPAGSSLGVAADSLARAGVIGSARLFRLYALVRHDDRDIKAGTYMLRRNSGYGSSSPA